MRCPVCDVSLSMADRQGIEIDFCPECRGVWLDRGELDKIVERSAADLAPQPSRDTGGYDDGRGYGKHGSKHGGGYSKHGGGGHGYGRKSWLREIFD
ncbi:zf-TFIIB domain-containing protein [Abyssibius alkaniclasticus]|nr:zf-TFIIB domain-containing protein [Abyssibius alkaniclasticus]UPH72818.1 zf-TFIIB domain-containing protein [Abyssibius alkaniclasticus]